MAECLEVLNGTTTLLPTTTWAAPNGLFGASADRNDNTAFGWADSTSTITLPSTIDADGYLFLWGFEFEDTSNGRHNPQGRMIQASGTGDFASAVTGGYNRDNSEDRAYVSGWSFVNNPSASSTYTFQWRRDSDTPTGGTVRAFIQCVPLYYSDVGIYTSTSTTATGGTTPSQITGFTGTDGTNITISSNVVTMTGDNKSYLCLGSGYHQGIGSSRTQRWFGFRIDGTWDDSAKGCMYFRNTSNADGGESFIKGIRTATADVTVDVAQYRGDGVGAGQGGADVDSNTTGSNSQHSLVVIELNDDAEVFFSTDSVGGQEFALTGPVDVDIASTGDIDHNDSGSFTRSSDTAVNCEQAMDLVAFANVSHARESSSIGSGSRWTVHGEFTINGTEQTDKGFHGNYNRGNQSTQDCHGSSCNCAGLFAVALNDDIGVSNQELSGTEGGAGDIETQAGWVGFGLINLDSLEAAAGGSTIDRTLTENIDMNETQTLDYPHVFEMDLSTHFADGAATTAQLTAPTGKTSGADFLAGEIVETSNPAPSINLGTDEYTEVEWSIISVSGVNTHDATYEFRVVEDDGTVLDTYTVTPELTLSEAGGAVIERTFNESVSVADQDQQYRQRYREIQNQFVTSEVLTRGLSVFKTLAMNINIQDNLVKVPLYQRLLTEGLDINDALDKDIIVQRIIQSTFATTDQIEVDRMLVKMFADEVSIDEVLQKGLELYREFGDNITVEDTLLAVAQRIMSALLADNIDVEDSINRQLVLSKLFDELYQPTDSIAKQHVFSKLLSDEVDLSEFLVRSYVAQRILNSDFELNDSVASAVQTIFSMVLAENISMEEIILVDKKFSKLVTDTMDVQENLLTQFMFEKLIADTFSIQDFLNSEIAGVLVRVLQENIAVEDAFNKQNFYMRLKADLIELEDVVQGYAIYYRQLGDVTEIFDNLTAQIEQIVSLDVTLSDNIEMFDDLSKAREMSVRITNAIILFAEVFKEVHAHRVLEDTFGYVDSEMIQRLLFKVVSDSLDLDDVVTRRIFGALPAVIKIVNDLVTEGIEIDFVFAEAIVTGLGEAANIETGLEIHGDIVADIETNEDIEVDL